MHGSSSGIKVGKKRKA